MSNQNVLKPTTGNDASAAWIEQKSIEAEVATMLPIEAYKSLSSVTRPLLIEMNDQFLRDPRFREYVRLFLHPQPYREPSQIFPFMKLPAELQIMVAKYALAADEGLEWYWKKEGGKRVGGFKTRSRLQVPVNNLCLSHELRQITTRMWLRVNTLRFKSDINDIDDIDDIDDDVSFQAVVQRGIEDYDFFLTNTTATDLAAVRSIEIHVDANLNTYRKFDQVIARHAFTPPMRVVSTDCILLGPSRGDVNKFMKSARRYKETLKLYDDNNPGRTWRTFPYINLQWHVFTDAGIKKENDVFQKYISGADLRLALDYVNNGI